MKRELKGLSVELQGEKLLSCEGRPGLLSVSEKTHTLGYAVLVMVGEPSRPLC